jgi:hypothetical protein
MEEWKTIEWASNYQVSTLGRVRQLGRTFERAHPKHPSHRQTLNIKPKILEGWVRMRKGKPVCRFVSIRINGTTKTFRVHQLVLTTFVGPCPDGMEGCHNNGDPLDNRVENLRWDTHLSNIADMHAHGRYSPPPKLIGERNPNAVLNEEQARYIRSIKFWPRGRIEEVARNLGVPRKAVSRVKLRQVWNHLPEGE